MTRGSEKILRAVLVFSMFVLCEGCASSAYVSLSTNQAKPISMTANINREYRVLRHINAVQKVPFLFLVRMNPGNANPELDQLLQPEFAETPGDAIVNVSIQGKASFGDILLPIGVGIAGGFVFAPLFIFVVTPLFEDLKTYTVEGDIVMYTDSKKLPEPERKFDPVTGVPAAKPMLRFDPATGLPIKP